MQRDLSVKVYQAMDFGTNIGRVQSPLLLLGCNCADEDETSMLLRRLWMLRTVTKKCSMIVENESSTKSEMCYRYMVLI